MRKNTNNLKTIPLNNDNEKRSMAKVRMKGAQTIGKEKMLEKRRQIV